MMIRNSRPCPLHRLSACYTLLLLLYTTMTPAAETEYGALPAPPRAVPHYQENTYYLTLVVNGSTNHQVVPVHYHDGHFAIEASVLAKNHIRTGAQNSGMIDTDTLPQVKTEYDQTAQALRFTVPMEWMPEQQVKENGFTRYTKAQNSPGAIFNYDVYYNNPWHGTETTSAWLEQRLFNQYGIISNTGVYRQRLSGKQQHEDNDGYLRYDTYWRFSDEDRMLSIQAGDLINGSLSWSNPVRLGGVRISRNYSVRPDIVTYPLFQYSGQNALPTSVDLFINGYRASSASLDSGPFTLTNVPYINGAGEATVVTKDALGREVSTSIPFYVSNTLLRRGLDDFDLSAGTLRRRYGDSNADYGQGAGSALYRYGATDWLTLSGHLEGTNNQITGGLGSDIGAGHWGTFSSAYSTSDSHSLPQGQQYTLGYSYYAHTFSLAAQHAQRSDHYTDLSSDVNNNELSQRSDQVTVSTTPFGEGNGTLGLGYFDIQSRNKDHTRLASLSHSWSMGHQTSLYLSMNKTLGESGYSALFQVIIPFDSGISVTSSTQRDQQDNYTERLSATQSAPTQGGVGWNVAYSTGHSHYRQAGATLKTQHAIYQGGIYGNPSQDNYWGEISGALLYMDNSLFSTDKVNDAFLLVSTDGYPDIPVNYENQLVGNTDKNGHVLVPWVSAWYPAKVAIDPLALPLGLDIPETEHEVAVKEGSGTLIHFPVKQVKSAMVTLVDENQTPLPVGSRVTNTASGETSVVGYDGDLFINNLLSQNHLSVWRPDNKHCELTLALPQHQTGIARTGTQVCVSTTSSAE